MKRCLLTAVVLMLFVTKCHAGQTELWGSLGLDQLAEAGEQYGAAAELHETPQLEGELERLLEQALAHLPQVLRGGLRSALMLLAVVVLCSVAEGLRAIGGEENGLNICVLAGTLAITALSAGDMSTMMGMGRRTIDSMQGFSQVLLPVVAACTAATGAAATAAARQVATALFSTLLLSVIDRLLVPLVYAYVAACAAGAAVGNPGLKKVAGVLKWVVTRSLTTLLILFVSYLSLSGAIAGTTDAAALKAAKMAISTAVPVVGGIISNAAQTLLVGAGLLKNAVGVFGMLVVLGICTVPFLQLGTHYLTYKFTGALAATLADRRLAELVDGIGTAFALVLGMTGASALLLLVSIFSAVAGGAA